ncbi:MAG: glycosyltransferase family 2 protein [Acidimicrobiales bacterium]
MTLIPTDRPAVDVVTLTWNDGDLLARSVEATLASTGVEVTLTIVDNCSDPSPVAPPDPRVRVIRNITNRGVRARNQGVRVGSSDFVAFVDSDACVHPDTLATLVATLQTNPDAALAAPVFDGQAPDRSAGAAPTLTRKLCRLVGLTRSYCSNSGSREAVWDVDFAVSACWVFRRSVFTALGGLDERYFYGPEDLDFCLRARLAGWRVIQVSGAGCAHAARRRFRSPLSPLGARHTLAVGRHLWKHRHFRRLLAQTAAP